MQALVLDHLHLAPGCRDPFVACPQVVRGLTFLALRHNNTIFYPEEAHP